MFSTWRIWTVFLVFHVVTGRWITWRERISNRSRINPPGNDGLEHMLRKKFDSLVFNDKSEKMMLSNLYFDSHYLISSALLELLPLNRLTHESFTFAPINDRVKNITQCSQQTFLRIQSMGHVCQHLFLTENIKVTDVLKQHTLTEFNVHTTNINLADRQKASEIVDELLKKHTSSEIRSLKPKRFTFIDTALLVSATTINATYDVKTLIEISNEMYGPDARNVDRFETFYTVAGYFKYHEENGVTMVEIPLSNGGTITVLHPLKKALNLVNGTGEDFVDKLRKNASLRELKLTIPRIKISRLVDVRQPLSDQLDQNPHYPKQEKFNLNAMHRILINVDVSKDAEKVSDSTNEDYLCEYGPMPINIDTHEDFLFWIYTSESEKLFVGKYAIPHYTPQPTPQITQPISCTGPYCKKRRRPTNRGCPPYCLNANQRLLRGCAGCRKGSKNPRFNEGFHRYV